MLINIKVNRKRKTRIYQGRRSPPNCIPSPVCLEAGLFLDGLAFGGWKFSNVRRWRATVNGVFAALGVQVVWAGLGVILTKSAKSNPCEGVAGAPNIERPPL